VPPTLTGVEMHEVLRGLVEQLGPEVFDDPDNFRGALDDVLDEDASLGEQNLVVDAVRLGAYASMVTMLRQGGAPGSTVAQAGAMLARDRGGHDRASASWACACLAYAVGAVDAAEVRHYRTAQAPPPPEPPVSAAPPPPPYSAPPPAPVPAAEPAPPRGQRLVPILVAVAVLLAAAAGVVGASLLRGDDDPSGPTAASDPPTSSEPTGPTSPTTSPPTTAPTTHPTTEPTTEPPPPPDPSPVVATVEYTCGASGTGDCYLSERAGPGVADPLIRKHDDGTTVRVDCQVLGQKAYSSVLDESSRVWARTTEGGYVAAIFLSDIDKFHVSTPCS
jgi:hypothetical protein